MTNVERHVATLLAGARINKRLLTLLDMDNVIRVNEKLETHRHLRRLMKSLKIHRRIVVVLFMMGLVPRMGAG